MGDFKLYKDWGTKPAHNKHKVRPVCKWCGAGESLVKDKRRAFGVASICNACHNDKYRDSEARQQGHAREATKRRVARGYTVVDGGGIMQKGAFVSWTNAHSPTGEGVPDGTILKHNTTGKVYEVWNKPILTEIQTTQP